MGVLELVERRGDVERRRRRLCGRRRERWWTFGSRDMRPAALHHARHRRPSREHDDESGALFPARCSRRHSVPMLRSPRTTRWHSRSRHGGRSVLRTIRRQRVRQDALARARIRRRRAELAISLPPSLLTASSPATTQRSPRCSSRCCSTAGTHTTAAATATILRTSRSPCKVIPKRVVTYYSADSFPRLSTAPPRPREAKRRSSGRRFGVAGHDRRNQSGLHRELREGHVDGPNSPGKWLHFDRRRLPERLRARLMELRDIRPVVSIDGERTLCAGRRNRCTMA